MTGGGTTEVIFIIIFITLLLIHPGKIKPNVETSSF